MRGIEQECFNDICKEVAPITVGWQPPSSRGTKTDQRQSTEPNMECKDEETLESVPLVAWRIMPLPERQGTLPNDEGKAKFDKPNQNTNQIL
jgi:hypothetical protein